jgi:hypothetical protein
MSASRITIRSASGVAIGECGPQCWNAREGSCACSGCGGRLHGSHIASDSPSAPSQVRALLGSGVLVEFASIQFGLPLGGPPPPPPPVLQLLEDHPPTTNPIPSSTSDEPTEEESMAAGDSTEVPQSRLEQLADHFRWAVAMRQWVNAEPKERGEVPVDPSGLSGQSVVAEVEAALRELVERRRGLT